jgi:putative transposase
MTSMFTASGKDRKKLNYIHENPVKRGLVSHPRDWPWSSWGFYYREESVSVRMDVG